MNQSLQESTQSSAPWRLSWDAILFILLWGAQLWSSEAAGMVNALPQNNFSLIVHLTRIFDNEPVPGLLLIVLMLYVGADLWLSGQMQFRLKLAAVWILVITFVIMPTLLAIANRHNGVPYLYVHDGAIQIEEALKFLFAGKNPYAENYAATPMAQWPFHYGGMQFNPALYHLPYLPSLLFSSVPFYLLAQAIIGWYDQRFVYLFLLVLTILMLLRVGRTPGERLAAVMVLGLNPLFNPFFIEGRNDIVLSFWLIGAILFLQQGWIDWGAIWVVGAITSKQTTWFLIPFFILYVLGWQRSQVDGPGWQIRLRALLPSAVLLGALILPFLIWDANAFIDDAVKFQTGTLQDGTNYPINSVGFGSLVLGLDWAESVTDPYPFTLLQLPVTCLALLVLLRRQWLNNTLKQMVMNYAILFLVSGFFSRTFNDNHLGFALTWLILPSFIGAAGVREAKPIGAYDEYEPD